MLEKLKEILRRRRPPEPFRVPGQIDDGARVLVLAGPALSDLVFHMPLLAGIRRAWPGASLDFLVPEELAPLVVPSGLARQVMVYNEKQLSSGWKPAARNLQRTLAAARYDVSFVVSDAPTSTLEALGLASGAALRYGPSHAGSWPAVNLELRQTPQTELYPGDRPTVLAPLLGLPTGRLRTSWPLPADKLRQVAQLVHFNKPRPDELLVGVDPGPDMDGRALSKENLLYLVQQLKSQLSCRILPLSGPSGAERRRQFEAGLTSPIPPAFNRDTILDTVLLLCQCDLFLAGNTDLFHVAVAEGVPALGLFGEQVAPRWEPRSRPRCEVLRVTRGERIEVGDLIGAVTRVRARGEQPGVAATPSGDPAANPLPAPGA